jgi:hypothetical protein
MPAVIGELRFHRSNRTSAVSQWGEDATTGWNRRQGGSWHRLGRRREWTDTDGNGHPGRSCPRGPEDSVYYDDEGSREMRNEPRWHQVVQCDTPSRPDWAEKDSTRPERQRHGLVTRAAAIGMALGFLMVAPAAFTRIAGAVENFTIDFGQLPNGATSTKVYRFVNPHGRNVGFRLSWDAPDQQHISGPDCGPFHLAFGQSFNLVASEGQDWAVTYTGTPGDQHCVLFGYLVYQSALQETVYIANVTGSSPVPPPTTTPPPPTTAPPPTTTPPPTTPPPTPSPAGDTKSTNVLLLGGALGVTGLSIGDFGPVTLDGTAKTTGATMASFSVVDATGSGAGWGTTLQASQFREWDGSAYVDGGKALPQNSLSMPEVTVTPVGTDSPSPTASAGPYVIDGPAPVRILTAGPQTGMGVFQIVPSGDLTLSIPASAFARSYRSDVVVSLVSGP